MTTGQNGEELGKIGVCPSPPAARPIPYGLVSLLDMINYSPAVSHSYLSIFEAQEGLARRKAGLNFGEYADAESVRQAREALTDCDNVFALLSSHAIRERIDGFERRLQFPLSWSDLAAEFLSLHDTVEAELKQHHFYHYPKNRGDKVVAFKREWGGVWPTNKSIQEEALAAVDCYALEHPTASVFHSMRVAEYGLRALARERKIRIKNRPIEWATWQDILKALEGDRKTIENKPAGAKKDADLAFYSGAISDLHAFKDEYRNMVMHVRATYDHFQALRALERVREFMHRVSARMDEFGKKRKP